MNFPPFVYAKAFWEAVTTAVAGLLALLAFLGSIDPSWAIPAAVMLTWIYAFLRMFGIEPELKAQALVKELEAKLALADHRLANVSRVTSKKK